MRMLIAAILLFTAANSETTTCYRDKEWTICETDDTMREIRAEEAREAREAHYQQMEAYALEAAGRAEVRELREGSYE